MIVYHLINTKIGFEDQTLEYISSLEGVKEAKRVFGAIDLFVKTSAQNESQAEEIKNKIEFFDNVKIITSLIKIPEAPELAKNSIKSENFHNTKSLAYFLIICTHDSDENLDENSVVAKLNDIPEVMNAELVFGSFDILVTLEWETIDKLRTIAEKIREIRNIRRIQYLLEIINEHPDELMP